MTADEQLLSEYEEIDNDEGDLFGTAEVIVDDDASVDAFPSLARIGCSQEDYKIIFKQKHPTSSQWKNVDGPSPYNVSAAIDGAREEAWNQAIREINFVREKVKDALGQKEPTILNLVDLIFGSDSSIGSLIEKKMAISNEDFLKVLGTYSLAAAYNLSKTQLFSKNSFVNATGLADEETY
jgi:hypothetical protein